MAAVANTWRTFTGAPSARRRGLLSPVLFAAVLRIVDVPSLRQSGEVVRGIFMALKAPNRIARETHAQIHRIDQTIVSVTASIDKNVIGTQDEEDYANYLYNAQEFVDELNRLRENLVGIKNKGYRGRLSDQLNLVNDLDLYDKAFLEVMLKFCLISGVLANLGGHPPHIGTTIPTALTQIPQRSTTRSVDIMGRLAPGPFQHEAIRTAGRLRLVMSFVIAGAFF